jgi:hypothetical protein
MNIIKLKKLKDSYNKNQDDIPVIDRLIEAKNEIDLRIIALDDLRKAGGVAFVQIQVVGNKARTVKEVLIDIAPDDTSFIDNLIALEETHLTALDVEALVYEDQADTLPV